MYRIVFALCALAGTVGAVGAQPNPKMNGEKNENNVLVVCFSATGTTARVAETLAKIVEGDFQAIHPERPYTAADLDWTDKRSRSSLEMNDPKARPEIAGEKIDMTRYDTVFIGYPIWWDLAPRIINTFIERYDLRGKILIPFATSGGSGISNSTTALKKEYPELEWRQGRLLNRTDEAGIRAWLEKSGGMR